VFYFYDFLNHVFKSLLYVVGRPTIDVKESEEAIDGVVRIGGIHGAKDVRHSVDDEECVLVVSLCQLQLGCANRKIKESEVCEQYRPG
jgi:hypothetical protein